MTQDHPPDIVPQTNLWGEEENPYIGALMKYGTYPITTWDVSRHDRAIEAMVGDGGEARKGVFQKSIGPRQVYRGTESIFDPRIAEWALRLWAPEPPAVVFDPFAGGGTRAIMATAHGLEYVGVELREEEVEVLRARIERAGNPGEATIIHGDSTRKETIEDIPDGSCGFLLTCPPYYSLETYQGGAADLSMAKTYREFQAGMERVVEGCSRVLARGAFSVWVIGLHRDLKSGALYPLPQDNVQMHVACGFDLMEEVILVRNSGHSIRRSGTFEKGGRHLVRNHEYLQVFRAPGP